MSVLLESDQQQLLPPGQQISLPIRVFDYEALKEHTCLIPRLLTSNYVCNRFTTLADQYAPLLQLHITSRYIWNGCNWQASTSIVVGLKQQVCLLHLPQTNSYVQYACHPTNGLVSTAAPDHQACMLQLHLTISHVFISCIISACTPVTVISYQHPCMLHWTSK